MAMILEFHQVISGKSILHGPVSCGWRAFEVGGTRILQLDTYGSNTRQIPNKVSQSIQLDRSGAAQLLDLIRNTFPGIEKEG
jgi:hypothetical protein